MSLFQSLSRSATAAVGRRAARFRFYSAIPGTMRAVVVNETGPAEVLTYVEDHAVPQVGDGQVLVQNEFAGINFIDTYHRGGLYPRELPFIGGQEGGGKIVATTPAAEAQGFAVGDSVVYSVFGSYAEYSAVPSAKLMRVPETVPMDVAVTCPVQALTAHYLTQDAHAGLIKPGEWMLIHAAGGGTCQWAAQMAKLSGFKVIATCSKSKEPIARSTGADEVIVFEEKEGTSYSDYSSVDIVQRVQEITGGQGAKAVIDGVGLATWESSIESLAPRGIFISFGNASGAVPAYPPLRHIAKSTFMTRPKLLEYTATREELDSRTNDVFKWIAEGKLNVSIDKVFDLKDAVEGHKYIESGASRGKILYRI
eukprot:INCI957.1.p1 GENE.INCI957.1~~INCI957.1.p1  ORF type:complete len:415 (-),score=79.08 INCI957.1:756-1856(-)